MTRDSPKKHVAIFQTDYAEKLKAEFGNYADMSAKALKTAGVEREIKVYDTIQGEYPSEEELVNNVKAIWITGSAFDAFADIPWINKLAEYIQWITKNHPQIPLVGICFGHQIIGKALGAKVGRNSDGWEYGVHEIKVNTDDEEVKELFGGFGESFRIQEVHQDVVLQLPEGLKCIGSTEKTKYQGFYKKKQILTFQGHPEFSSDYMYALMQGMKVVHTEFSEEFIAQSEVKAQETHNGSDLSKVIANFIESSDN